MKPLYILLSLICMGCEKRKSETKEASGYDIVVLDGCEYIEQTRSSYPTLTHKGNCKNKIHYK